MHRLLLPLLLLTAARLSAQTTLRGQVTTADGETLAFVSVLAETPTERRVALTDIEGRYQIDLPAGWQTLTVRYVGFGEQRFRRDSLPTTRPGVLNVVLRPADYALAEVSIVAGENPADRLIKLATEQRVRNNPERNGPYRCRTYNKVAFEALPNQKEFQRRPPKNPKGQENFKKLQQQVQERQSFLLESVTERRFLPPNLVQEQVLLNRVSGFEQAEMVALANAVQPFSFYGDYVTILDKNFVNPISPGSTKLYFFNLEDTLYPTARDTVWVISFKPRRGKVFLGLKGVLHLHSYRYALQNVSARPAFGAENLDLKIEQAYRLYDCTIGRLTDSTSIGQSSNRPIVQSSWFPAQLNFELSLPKYPSPLVGMHASGRSFVTDVELDAPLTLRDFNAEQPLLLERGANTRDSALWAPWRQLAPLSRRELRTYTWLDSIGEARRFDRWSKALNALSTGLWPLREPLSVNLGKVLKFNDFETVRVGVGLTNAQWRPLGLARRLEWGGSVAYGFKDGYLKYGGYALWRLRRNSRTHLRVAYRRDLLEPGAPYELQASPFFTRALYARRMDLTDEVSASLASRLGRNAEASLTVRQQHLRPVRYNYQYQPGSEVVKEFDFQEVTGYFRWAYGERVRRFLGNNVATTQRLPVVELAVTQGWGKYRYTRWLGALYQSLFVPRLGRLSWRLEGGLASPTAPLAKLFTVNQTGGGFGNVLVVEQTFQSMPDTLLLHDRFVNLFLAQEVGPVLWQKKYTAPLLTVVHNSGWGRLSRPELVGGLESLSIVRPTFESGLLLDNLLRFNYVNAMHLGLGGAVFYRWGHLADPDWRRNVVPRLSLKWGI